MKKVNSFLLGVFIGWLFTKGVLMLVAHFG